MKHNNSRKILFACVAVLLSLGGAALAQAPVVSLSPTSLNFGPMYVNKTTPAQKVTLINTGNATLSITSIVASGDFAQTNTCGSVVASGADCTISITFAPTATGSRTGALTITHDAAAGTPHTVFLAGTGTTPLKTMSCACTFFP